MFCKKGVLRNFAKIHSKTPLPESLFVFSCEFYEISKNTFSYKHLRWLLLIYSITFGTPFQHTNKVLSFRVKYKGFNASFAYYSVWAKFLSCKSCHWSDTNTNIDEIIPAMYHSQNTPVNKYRVWEHSRTLFWHVSSMKRNLQ